MPLPESSTTEDEGLARSKSRYRRVAPTPYGSGQQDGQPVLHGNISNLRTMAVKDRISGSQAEQPLATRSRPPTNTRAPQQNEKPTDHGGRKDSLQPPTLCAGQITDCRPQSGVNADPLGSKGTSQRREKRQGGLLQTPTPAALLAGTGVSNVTSEKQPTYASRELYAVDNSDSPDPGCLGLCRNKADSRPGSRDKLLGTRPKPKTVAVAHAPISAVNAGARSVLVACGSSKILLAVTPDTTALDIIKSAAKTSGKPIDINDAVLVEDFVIAGVQRPLRRYEGLRSVLNSWDNDKQNSLILTESGHRKHRDKLEVAGAPSSRPGEETFLLDVSQRPGKWDTRTIILHETGQVTAQKDPHKPAGQTNVCHLSDFDIYRPTPERQRTKIRPPKRICFAVKSQQKTTLFESAQDFVHLFCTNDNAMAERFYAAVQGWRSWYLVNVRGDGGIQKPPPNKSFPETTLIDLGVEAGNGGRPDLKGQLKQSIRSPPPTRTDAGHAAPQSIGFSKTANQLDTTISPERRGPVQSAHGKTIDSTFTSRKLGEDEPLANLARKTSAHVQRPLLGSRGSSSEHGRKTNAFSRTSTSDDKDRSKDPAVDGPPVRHTSRRQTARSQGDALLPNNTSRNDIKRSDSGSETGTPSSLQRVASTHSKGEAVQKPLVDLTPQYREPPQHAKKGRAFIPAKAAVGGLIDNATSPEDPLGLPPVTDWRGRNAA